MNTHLHNRRPIKALVNQFQQKPSGYRNQNVFFSTKSQNQDHHDISHGGENKITEIDIQYMNLAIDAAKKGIGNTYPNPAVGCVLVNHQIDDNADADDEIIGIGLHPKAGYPHAEIFALFQACHHVPSGIEAAEKVIQNTSAKAARASTRKSTSDPTPDITMEKINELLHIYSSIDYDTKDEGAKRLFQDAFVDQNVTAYVTLEPCCHYGKDGL
jgi:diaminohydroxyphosphoribosylaminopyrimidine deaminase/5-amino-6-(5-phosphoribosylamino)uracil reductase